MSADKVDAYIVKAQPFARRILRHVRTLHAVRCRMLNGEFQLNAGQPAQNASQPPLGGLARVSGETGNTRVVRCGRSAHNRAVSYPAAPGYQAAAGNGPAHIGHVFG